MINTARQLEEKSENNKCIEKLFSMKLDYIKEQSGELATILTKKTLAVTELNQALAEDRELEQRKRMELNDVLMVLKEKSDVLADAERQTNEGRQVIEEQEIINKRLRREIAELEKQMDLEQQEKRERHAELGKARKDEREAYHELQEVKGNIRVCLRIRPDYVSANLNNTVMEDEESMLQFKPEENSIKLTMPRSVAFSNCRFSSQAILSFIISMNMIRFWETKLLKQRYLWSSEISSLVHLKDITHQSLRTVIPVVERHSLYLVVKEIVRLKWD